MDLAEAQARIVELEHQLAEHAVNRQLQYSQAWSSWLALLKRVGAAAGVELPSDLRYYQYENRVVDTIIAMRAAGENAE